MQGRYAQVLLLTLLLLLGMVTLATPASADRCQPEEIVGLEPITDEDSNPVCGVMDRFVYPALGCDGTLLECPGEVLCEKVLRPGFCDSAPPPAPAE